MKVFTSANTRTTHTMSSDSAPVKGSISWLFKTLNEMSDEEMCDVEKFLSLLCEVDLSLEGVIRRDIFLLKNHHQAWHHLGNDHCRPGCPVAAAIKELEKRATAHSN